MRCISFSIKYIQRPRDQEYEYLHLLNIFLFLDFPAGVGVWEAQKALFTEVKIGGNWNFNWKTLTELKGINLKLSYILFLVTLRN